jgi:mono/diheme cytochrome c family protein
MRIHPIFIMAAPVMVLVSCTQHVAHGGPVRPLQVQQTKSEPTINAAVARTLFLRNCAHCHGADAHGDDGPDLHGIDWTKEEIANRIRKGKAGQMTAFAGKLKPEEIEALVTYVRELN